MVYTHKYAHSIIWKENSMPAEIIPPGLEVYDRLQEREETRGVPAIMMSAALPIEELQQRGIYQLRKPMDVGGVIRMITHALATFEEQHLYKAQQYH